MLQKFEVVVVVVVDGAAESGDREQNDHEQHNNFPFKSLKEVNCKL